jgi:hypothetical protein
MSGDERGVDASGGDGGEGLAQRLIGELGQVRAELAEAKAAIAKGERRALAERAVVDAQARDVRAALEAVEQRLAVAGGGGGNGDGDLSRRIAQAVEGVKRERPGLFAPSGPAGLRAGGVGAGGLGASGEGAVPTLAVLRERAQGGDRASLLLYLKARRSRG